VVAASANGDASYMASNGDDTFSAPEVLQITAEHSNITEPNKMSYGNALGDFDGDGDLDYIMGIGWGNGHIYISEKIGVGNQFAAPQVAATWGLPPPAPGMPTDMAVADFDEDGSLDFVMSYMYRDATGLYLGDGALGFSSVTLPLTAPYLSVGIDAADFNNDGHADFIVAPYSNDPFFINLGNGDGTFTTHRVATVDGGALWGVAAADFDNDGVVDIAAAYYDYLYIYKGVKDAAGNVDGKTFIPFASYEYDMNQSPLDNYDFDGDGNQDLVAANYGDNTAGVVVFFGNGDGSFTFGGTYAGEITAANRAVTAPPQQMNKEPVAVIEPAFLEVTAGDEIVFDGSNSYDEDGQIVNYEWDFGDADPAAPAALSTGTFEADSKASGDKPSHTYYQAGAYTVTLTVTDDKDATNTIQAEVSVLPAPVPQSVPVAVTVKFSPHKLDQHKRHRWLKATIRLPENLDAADVDLASLYIEVEGSNGRIYAAADSHHGFFSKYLHRIQRKKNVVKVKFDWRALLDAIETPSDNTVLTLHLKGTCGYEEDKVEFQGDGTIQAVKKPKQRGFGD